MRKKLILAALAPLVFALSFDQAGSDEFDDEDLERWEEQFMQVVEVGRDLWTDGTLGTNGVSCAQCHPNAANTHPETKPKHLSLIHISEPTRPY